MCVYIFMYTKKTYYRSVCDFRYIKEMCIFLYVPSYIPGENVCICKHGFMNIKTMCDFQY